MDYIGRTLEIWLRNLPKLPEQAELNDLKREWLLIRDYLPREFRPLIEDRITLLQAGIDRQSLPGDAGQEWNNHNWDSFKITLEGDLLETAINREGQPIYRYLYQGNIYAVVCPLAGAAQVFHIACCLPDQ